MSEFYEPISEKPQTVNEKLDAIAKQLDEKTKPKKFKLPWKSRVGKKKVRQGWITVVEINDNKNINFSKAPIIGGTFKLDGTIHVPSEKDIYFYKNKPIVFQPKKKINPYNPLDGESETYGDEFIIARMERDAIKGKKDIGMGIWIVVGIVVIAGAYYLFTGG